MSIPLIRHVFLCLLAVLFLVGCGDVRRQSVELDAIDQLRALRCISPKVSMLTADTVRADDPGSPSAHLVRADFSCGKSTDDGLVYNLTITIDLTKSPEHPDPVTLTLPVYVTVLDSDLTIRSRKTQSLVFTINNSVTQEIRRIQTSLPYPSEKSLLDRRFGTDEIGPQPETPLILNSDQLISFARDPVAFTVFIGFVPSEDDIVRNALNYNRGSTTYETFWTDRQISENRSVGQ